MALSLAAPESSGDGPFLIGCGCPCATEALAEAQHQLRPGESDTFWIDYPHECDGEPFGYRNYLIGKDSISGVVCLLAKSWTYSTF